MSLSVVKIDCKFMKTNLLAQIVYFEWTIKNLFTIANISIRKNSVLLKIL